MMQEFKLKQDPRVPAKFSGYPAEIRPKLTALRELILDVARHEAGLTTLEETLKWGEPSYLAKKGSTLRLDWKAKTPDQYALYFKCTSKLVPTFREVYGARFTYEDNRAIVFKLTEALPRKELRDCITMALQYHSLKHLPRLGR